VARAVSSAKAPPAHVAAPTLGLAERREHLSLHNQRMTSYLEMSKGLAASGIDRWTFDTSRMTITYYDTAGHEMLVEAMR
jgi:hypothetical protein